MSERVLALIDGNSFYCSCERVFDGRLAKRPVIVLSNNDGCAVARSEDHRTGESLEHAHGHDSMCG